MKTKLALYAMAGALTLVAGQAQAAFTDFIAAEGYTNENLHGQVNWTTAWPSNSPNGFVVDTSAAVQKPTSTPILTDGIWTDVRFRATDAPARNQLKWYALGFLGPSASRPKQHFADRWTCGVVQTAGHLPLGLASRLGSPGNRCSAPMTNGGWRSDSFNDR